MTAKPTWPADVSRETIERLEHYEHLVAKWNPKINLIAPGSLEVLRERHFLDSLQLLPFVPARGLWADLGSGGGFPALVLAAATQDRKDVAYTLVESDGRKSAFLRTVVRELGLNATIKAERVEKLAPLGADIVSARALAPLSGLLDYAARHLKTGGLGVFPKGANHRAEYNEALERWRFEVQTVDSVTQEGSAIYLIKDIQRA